MAQNTKKPSALKSDSENKTMTFTRQNYILVIIGIAFLILGFILMIGGGSSNPDVFNEKALFGFQRITIAPILVLVGFCIEIIAIMKKTK